MSMTVEKSVPISPCRANPGQVRKPTTRIPPSVVKALCRREARWQLAPSAGRTR